MLGVAQRRIEPHTPVPPRSIAVASVARDAIVARTGRDVLAARWRGQDGRAAERVSSERDPARTDPPYCIFDNPQLASSMPMFEHVF